MKRALLYLLILLFVAPLCSQEAMGISAVKEQQKLFSSYRAASDNYYNEGNYKKSLETNIELLKIALKLNDPYYKHIGYRFLAYDYLAIEDTIAARENFKKSEKFAIEARNDTSTAYMYMDLANLYSTLEFDYKKAMDYHNQSVSLLKKIKDSANLAKAHYNIVLTAFEAEEFNLGYAHLLRAKKLSKFYNHPAYAVGIDNLMAEYYYNKENYVLSETYARKAIQAAEKDSLYIELETAYATLSESLYMQTKYEEAFEARDTYEVYNNQNIKSSIFPGTDAISAKFQVEEFRKDIQAAETENYLQGQIVENKSKLNTVLIIVSICISFLLLVLYFAFRKRKELVAELQIKNTEYLMAKEETERLSKAKRDFFSTVSHELRTPLYGVIGLSTLLLEDEALKTHTKDLKSLKFSADYLLALINDVLHINKIDSKTVEDEKAYFDIRELIRTIVSSFEYMRLQNANVFRIEIDDDIPKLVRGNSVRLSQILMNLIGNACKFTEQGTIFVTAKLKEISSNQATITFAIRDTGIGIAKTKQSTIFEEFSQGTSLNYNYQGSGLGLPIVKKLLALSNSEITLESELGQGTVFSFDLTYDILNKAYKREETPLLDTGDLKDKSVLIVEDNRINQTVTRKILEREGVICTIAENGLIAVNKVKTDTYHLILMDINMPVKNGLEATKEIREFDKTIPILALTAVEVEEMRHHIYESGMNDIIVKPYDISKFTQTILKHLKGRNENGQTTHSKLRAM
jgi:signal transduction histidine kinase/ActR/RegA family two-component response regulator